MFKKRGALGRPSYHRKMAVKARVTPYLLLGLFLCIAVGLNYLLKDRASIRAGGARATYIFPEKFYRIASSDFTGFLSRLFCLNAQSGEWKWHSEKEYYYFIKRLKAASGLDKRSYYPYMLAFSSAPVRMPICLRHAVSFIETGIERFPQKSEMPFRLACLYRFYLNDPAKALYYAEMARERTMKYDKTPTPFIISFPAIIRARTSGFEAGIIYLESLLREVESKYVREKLELYLNFLREGLNKARRNGQ